jgi:hypothetical protein
MSTDKNTFMRPSLARLVQPGDRLRLRVQPPGRDPLPVFTANNVT